MTQLNNLDVAILIILAVSALIAFSRGLIKEVLSIVGWVLSGFAVIWLLPIFTPITKQYIDSGLIAGLVSSIFILVLFSIIWIMITDSMIGKIRVSRLNTLDRLLGLFFGLMRASLLIILINILVSWIIPENKQPEFMQESKYFKLAGEFAKPIENLIPQETLDLIKKKADEYTSKEKPTEEELKKEENKQKEADALFEKLVQPKIEKKSGKDASDNDKKVLNPVFDEFLGYNNNERANLERLIDTVD